MLHSIGTKKPQKQNTCTAKNKTKLEQQTDKEKPATMQLLQFKPQLNLASPHQDKTARKRTRRDRVERHFLNWVGQSDQEGAIECVRVRERKKERETETEVERGWGRGLYTIGLDMNAPRHSFPHIPFNFNSLMELATLHPLSHTVHKETAHVYTHTHTNTQAHALMERDTNAQAGKQTTHIDTNIF